MVLYTYGELETKRKELITRDRDYTLDSRRKIGECRELILSLHPELVFGTREFDSLMRKHLLKKRAANLKELARLYKHAKNRTAYNYTHWHCGLNQKFPQRANRVISQFLGDEIKTKVNYTSRPFMFLSSTLE